MSDVPFDTQVSNMFTNVRHFMWNDDYVELLSHRLELQHVRALAEIGSGLGYLSRLFGLYMKPGGIVYGYDANEEAVEAARQAAAAAPFSVRYEFGVANPAALPLGDGRVDLAIAHHAFMSLADPAAALAEMVRVVKPGGRVVVFEPNSLIQSLIRDRLAEPFSVEERLDMVRYQLYYERGKRLLGLGDDSIGDQLPRLFHQAGLTRIEVRISDKSAALIPPYDTPEEQARVHELLSWLDNFQRNEDTIRRCFIHGGGTEAEFAAFFNWECQAYQTMCEQIQAERFIHPGGVLTYIVVGTRPRH
jgi:ubiquinone/menaquinone biosynthesis C-methylase UbiE